jgi:hypothetical protein
VLCCVVPEGKSKKEFTSVIQSLPDIDTPALFGLPPNIEVCRVSPRLPTLSPENLHCASLEDLHCRHSPDIPGQHTLRVCLGRRLFVWRGAALP